MAFLGFIIGFTAWFLSRYLVAGLYTVDQNERAVKTSFGRADRLGKTTLEDPFAETLREEERARYTYPQLRVIPPGGPYFRWPWERVYKVSVATQITNMATDPEDPRANKGGTELEAVTKDQLNIGLTGQIRYRICERNLYAYLFGVKQPIVHVMGYFISVLRERIANFEAPERTDLMPHASGSPGESAGSASEAAAGVSANPFGQSAVTGAGTDPASGAPVAKAPDTSVAIGVSINDLRKNLRDLNELMDRECLSSEARYGITFDASLITGIDPPTDVESALAAINTAHNQVSSDISLAQAAADQKIVQSRRAVEIETLKAQAEVEPLKAMAGQLAELKKAGPQSLAIYLRNVRLRLLSQAGRIVMEVPE